MASLLLGRLRYPLLNGLSQRLSFTVPHQLGQHRQRFGNIVYCPDSKLIVGNGLTQLVGQTKMANVGGRDNHALFSGETALLTDCEETFNFSFSPPTGCTRPNWSTEPVIAML